MSTDQATPKKIGVISCSGGAAFLEAHQALEALGDHAPIFHVVTDRPCGIESSCAERGIGLTRIEENDIERFCSEASRVLIEEQGVSMVLLFFHRVVTQSLWGRVPTLNIHPSLLPAYQGFSPLKRALADGVKHFGATLHLATDAIDAGPILAQISQPVPTDATLESLSRMSFIQKTCLTLLACEALMTDRLAVDLGQGRASFADPIEPGVCLAPTFVTGTYRDAFVSVQARHDVPGPAIQL